MQPDHQPPKSRAPAGPLDGIRIVRPAVGMQGLRVNGQHVVGDDGAVAAAAQGQVLPDFRDGLSATP